MRKHKDVSLRFRMKLNTKCLMVSTSMQVIFPRFYLDESVADTYFKNVLQCIAKPILAIDKDLTKTRKMY